MSGIANRVASCAMAVVLAVGMCVVPRDAHAVYGAASLAGAGQEAGDEWVTAIVQLSGQPAAPSGAGKGTFSLRTQAAQARARHALVQNEIGNLVGQDSRSQGGLAPLSAGADGESFQTVADYYNAVDGFAVRVPSSALDGIRALDGVESAFVEHAYAPPEDLAVPFDESAGAQSNQHSLDMTAADQVAQRGEGQVVAVIDTGVEVGHQAFAGDMDDGSLAWTSQSIAAAKAKLSQGGKGAAYVNEKIPFSWDYGDNDDDPHGINNHGTHVAGIAVANAGETRGTAPGAQLLAMRVARDRDGAMTDTAILAALDDAIVLQPDVINMSLGSDGGFFDDATNIYSVAFKSLEAAGCTLCVSAGNAYYSTHRDAGNLPFAANPDVGTVASPSSHVVSFSVASADNADVASGEKPRMSSFSSWGPTPELKLKPEITGPGGNIWSSVYDNGYDTMSGTSMSSPHIAGLVALVTQYVESDAKFAALDAAERHDRVTQLLMSTAVPLENPDVAGSYASPRHQGAGMANVKAAVTTDVYATVEGAEDPSRPKAELGSSADGRWEFSLTLHNLGGSAASFTPDTCALSDRVVGGKLQMSPANHAGSDIAVSYGGSAFDGTRVTVPAGGEATLAVSVACSDAFRSSLAEAGQVNGAYVEGFVRLLAQGDGVDLSVPYLGFCGAYDDVPAFDVLVNSGSTPQIYASRLVSRSGNATHPLGVNPLEPDTRDGDIDLTRVVISHANLSLQNPECAYVAREVAAAPSSVSSQTGLLRNAAKLRYTYRNSAGDVVGSYEYSDVTRSMTMGYSYPEADLSVPAFTGYDEQGRALPDGAYTLQEEFFPAGGAGASQSQTFSFYLDTAAPQVSGPTIEGSGDGAKVVVTVTDDTFLAAVDLVSADVAQDAGRGYYYRFDASKAQPTRENGKNAYRFELPLSDAQAAYEKAGLSGSLSSGTLAACAWDYGLNWTRTVSAPVSDFVIEDGVLTAYRGSDLSVSVPSGVSAIGGRAFYNSRVRSVSLPASVRRICDEAFYQASALTRVSVEDTAAAPSRLTFIGVRAFAGTGLKRFDIPDAVNSIGKQAFANTSLTQLSAGAKARIDASMFHSANPKHLVMRGARSYVASYEAADLNSRPMETAFFGEGVRSIEFFSEFAADDVAVKRDDYAEEYRSYFGSASPVTADGTAKAYGIAPPKVIAVPSSCTTLALTPDQAKLGMPGYSVKTLVRYDPSSVTIYAPEGTTGWATAKAALASIGADPGKQLVPFSAIPSEVLDEMGATGLTLAPSAAEAAAAEKAAREAAAREAAEKAAREAAQTIASVKLASASVAYTGKAITPAVTVTAKDSSVVGASNYTVAYANNVKVGTATVTVTGKGAYTGTATATFKITRASLAKAKVTLKKASAAYTGKTQKGAVKSVVLGGRTLKQGTDFTVSAKSGKKAGSYAVTVTGKGNYSGTAKATYTVKRATPKTSATKTKTLKAKALAKKAQTFRAVKVTTDGKVSYKVVGNSAKKKVSFKAGKVTVKKGTAPGTYKLKVKVSAKTGTNYKALAAKTYTITVKVK